MVDVPKSIDLLGYFEIYGMIFDSEIKNFFEWKLDF